MRDAEPDVRAAGGVVVRAGEHGPEVLLVHRPRYDDWSLPKGKVDPGEADEECALREVEEEASVRCRLEAELPSVRYLDRKGRDKVVRYWRMAVLDGVGAPAHEVDEVRWLPVDDAVAMLSYPHDEAVVRAAFR